MLFADIALARRTEAAECRLSMDIAESFRGKGRDAFVVPVAGGAVVFAGTESPFNKLIGAGFGDPVDEAVLERAERAYAERGATIRAEVSSLADPATVTTLSRRGYALIGFEDVLGRRLDDLPPAPASGAHVREAASTEDRTYVDVVVTGFMTPDTQGVPSNESFPREVIEPLFLDMLDVPGYHHFLAYLDGRPVGGGALRLDGGLALLAGASTLPADRRRGVQTALLIERLRWAAAHGCDLAVVTTMPGSKSQENVLRRGFERLYTRAVMIRTP
jgi:GNAT superfamily N-acetyltransferase